MSEYEAQANEFLSKSGTKMTISRIGEVEGFPFDDKDSMWHDKYQVTLSRDGKQYRFQFYGSFYDWQHNKRPSRYDVLACVEKYEVPDKLEDFAAEFGYDLESSKDYKRVNRIWEACKKQYEKLLWLFGDEFMEQLQQIC